MGNNGASKQSTGKIFMTERLLINLDAEMPAEANPNGEIVIKESARMFVVDYFNRDRKKVKDIKDDVDGKDNKDDKDCNDDEDFKDDKDKWEALAKGDSVQTVDKAAAVKNLYSQWQISETERMTVYNPRMKYSPVKVTRIDDVVYINIWVEKKSEYMHPMVVVKSPEGLILPRTKNIWDLVIEAFKFWAGKYKAKKNVDVFDFYDEIHVEVLIHENPVTPQNYVRIVVHDVWEVPAENMQFTFAAPLDADGKELNAYKCWSVNMKGYLINACSWFRSFPSANEYIDYPFDDISFKIGVAHEVGHLLGLAEAYDLKMENETTKEKVTFSVDDSSKEVPPEDLMRSGKMNTRIVTPNDIEMILNCWMEEGKIQIFYDMVEGNDEYQQSKVIRTAPDKITITKG